MRWVWLGLVVSGWGLCPPAHSLSSVHLKFFPLVVERVGEGSECFLALLLADSEFDQNESPTRVNRTTGGTTTRSPVLAEVCMVAEESTTRRAVVEVEEIVVALFAHLRQLFVGEGRMGRRTRCHELFHREGCVKVWDAVGGKIAHAGNIATRLQHCNLQAEVFVDFFVFFYERVDHRERFLVAPASDQFDGVADSFQFVQVVEGLFLPVTLVRQLDLLVGWERVNVSLGCHSSPR